MLQSEKENILANASFNFNKACFHRSTIKSKFSKSGFAIFYLSSYYKKNRMKKLIILIYFLVLNFSIAYSITLIEFVWSGAITSNSAIVVAKVQPFCEGLSVRIIATTDSNFTSGLIYSVANTANLIENNLVLKFQINGLSPLNQYYYRVEVAGIIDNENTGKFFTLPEENEAYSFNFAASCGNHSASNHPVFEAIKNSNPLFFLHTGDFHYGDIENDDIQAYRDMYESKISGTQKDLYQNVPIVYMWDDHDFGPNDACRLCDGKPAVHQVYRNYIPHYQLAGVDTTPIYQAFTVGRVRFIVTDLRTTKDPGKCSNTNVSHTNSPFFSIVNTITPDGSNKTNLGIEQKQWFKEELLSSSRNYELVVWVSTIPWIGSGAIRDQWWSYSYERREIANFIEDNCIHNLCMIAGDMHGCAIDDGSHNGYYNDTTSSTGFETSSAHGFPILQAGSLSSGGSIKGGPYSHGQKGESGQFGYISIVDTGEQIVVNWEARNVYNQVVAADSAGLNVGGYISYSFSPEPKLNFEENLFYITTNDSIIVEGGSGFSSYLWQDGSTNQSITISSGGIYNLSVTNNYGCLMTDSVEVIELSTDFQILNLLSGWNLLSTYIDPADPSCESVFSPIFQELILIKDQYGAVFWTQYQINMIGSLSIGKAYRAKLSQNAELFVLGSIVVPENTQILLIEGWNLIGYLRFSPAPITEMLTTIVSEIVLVKDGFGNVYWPQNNINQIVYMNPGLGYEIKMQNAGSFSYPPNLSL